MTSVVRDRPGIVELGYGGRLESGRTDCGSMDWARLFRDPDSVCCCCCCCNPLRPMTARRFVLIEKDCPIFYRTSACSDLRPVHTAEHFGTWWIGLCTDLAWMFSYLYIYMNILFLKWQHMQSCQIRRKEYIDFLVKKANSKHKRYT